MATTEKTQQYEHSDSANEINSIIDTFKDLKNIFQAHLDETKDLLKEIDKLKKAGINYSEHNELISSLTKKLFS